MTVFEVSFSAQDVKQSACVLNRGYVPEHPRCLRGRLVPPVPLVARPDLRAPSAGCSSFSPSAALAFCLPDHGGPQHRRHLPGHYGPRARSELLLPWSKVGFLYRRLLDAPCFALAAFVGLALWWFPAAAKPEDSEYKPRKPRKPRASCSCYCALTQHICCPLQYCWCNRECLSLSACADSTHLRTLVLAELASILVFRSVEQWGAEQSNSEPRRISTGHLGA